MAYYTPRNLARWLRSKLGTGLVGAEVGCAEGDHLRILLGEPGLISSLIAVDPWKCYPMSHVYSYDPNNLETQEEQDRRYRLVSQMSKEDPRLTVIRGESLDAVDGVEDGSLDFVFIDGDHSAEAVAKDAREWLRKTRPGGVLVFHDYTNGPVYKTKDGIDSVLTIDGPVEGCSETVYYTVS